MKQAKSASQLLWPAAHALSLAKGQGVYPRGTFSDTDNPVREWQL